MKVGISHCLLLIFVFLILQVLSASPRSQIIIRSDHNAENCTREGDVVICPCNITYNGTYYPCWIPLNNATIPQPNSTCWQCSPGSFSNKETSPECTKTCPAGSCVDPYKCELCPVGSFSNVTGSTSCSPCSPGSFARSQGSINCTACSEGSYSDNSGSSVCKNCAPGRYARKSGSDKCDLCPPGEFSKEAASTCLRCGQGTYNSAWGVGSCTPCGVGYYGPNTGQTDRDTACKVCPAGSYCPDGQTGLPVSCPRNYYCEGGASSPSACSPLYTSKPGQKSCAPSMGFYLLIFGLVGLVAISVIIAWRWLSTRRRQRVFGEPKQLEIDRLIPKARGPVYSGL